MCLGIPPPFRKNMVEDSLPGPAEPAFTQDDQGGKQQDEGDETEGDVHGAPLKGEGLGNAHRRCERTESRRGR